MRQFIYPFPDKKKKYTGNLIALDSRSLQESVKLINNSSISDSDESKNIKKVANIEKELRLVEEKTDILLSEKQRILSS